MNLEAFQGSIYLEHDGEQGIEFPFTIKQRKGETLKAFAQKFNKEKIIANCNKSIVMEAFIKGLFLENLLYNSPTMKTLSIMIDATERANEFIKLEEGKQEERREKIR